MSVRIPVIIPTHDESLSSYIYRLCRKFHFDSVDSFISPLNLNKSKLNNNEFTDNDLHAISEFTGQSTDLLYKMTGGNWRKSWGAKLYNKLIVKNKAKFCPFCIQNDDTVHRKIWSVLPVSVCPEHKVILVDHCQGCNSSISMEDLMFGFCCRCNHKLAASTATPIDVNSIFYESQIHLIQVINNSSLIEEGSQYSSLELLGLYFKSFHLLSGMNSFIDFGDKVILPYHNKREMMKDQLSCATAFGNAFWMYENFPRNFQKVLEEFYVSKGKKMYYQKPEFEILFQNKRYASIQSVYNQFWIDKLNRGCIRRDFSIFKLEVSLMNRVHSLRKDNVKTGFNITYQAISKMELNGSIKTRKIKIGKNTRYLIDKASVTKALQLERLFITNSEAAQFLGIQRNSIPKLIDSGVFKLKNSPTQKLMLYRPDVEHVLSQCRGSYVNGKVQGVQFHKALIKHTVNGLTIAKLLEFTLSGMLHPVTKVVNGSLADTFYCESELEHCIKLLKQETLMQKGYYMKDIMKLFRIGEQSVRTLIDIGVISPPKEVIMKDGRKHYFFDKRAIDSFLGQHLTIEEAASEFNISPVTIRRLLQNGEITDAFNGHCRHYLVSRQELTSVLVK